MKIWFKTKNYQIIPITMCSSFWIEEAICCGVFCKFEDCDLKIGEFENLKEAQEYIDHIFTILTSEEILNWNEL